MIRIGPVGWSHPALERLWPRRAGESFDALRFLGGYFGCIEIDVTEHASPGRPRVVRWLNAIADAPRTQFSVRLPSSLTRFELATADRVRDADRFMSTLAPLLRRQRLGALVARLPSTAIFGHAETRALAGLARQLAGAPLVLEARHASWYERRALDALRGAGWSLSHNVFDDRYDAPPRAHAPTGPIGMLRLLAPGLASSVTVEDIATRARSLANMYDRVLVVAANSSEDGADPAARFASAMEIKFVLAGARRVLAWPELLAAFPHLDALIETTSP